jgi:hypothetical protein
VWCFDCREWGHGRKECPANLKGSSANVVTHKSDSDSGSDVLSVAIKRQTTEDWLLDSATSFHVIHKREWFSSYKCDDFGKVYLGDDRGQPTIGIGEVRIKMQDGVDQVL